jgi:thiol-disulfide isomerase/thioredoxin
MIRPIACAAVSIVLASPPSLADDAAPSLEPILAVLDDASSIDVDGKVVYLDFWASWCAPCRTSFPWMREMASVHGDEGLRIVTVDVDRNPDLGRRFAAALEVDLPIIEDPDGKLAERFALEAMPTAFIFDRSGTLRLRHEGFRPADTETLETLLAELLAEPATDTAPPSGATPELAPSDEETSP